MYMEVKLIWTYIIEKKYGKFAKYDSILDFKYKTIYNQTCEITVSLLWTNKKPELTFRNTVPESLLSLLRYFKSSGRRLGKSSGIINFKNNL